MKYGYTGKILRINLSTKKTSIEFPEENFYRKYFGGRNIALYYMIREIPKKIDPYAEQNKLIFATSIITGTKIPGSSRFTVAAKSPLTERFGESQGGGWWGPELKFAGYDALIIEGKSDSYIYIYINNDNIEFLDASNFLDKNTGFVEKEIRKQLNSNKIKVLQCGPAGEKLVRFANIVNSLKHFNGRSGLGAVMGSKKLRAIAVNGDNEINLKDNEFVNDYVKWFSKNIENHPGLKIHKRLGTAKGVIPMNESGMLPTYNFKTGYFNDAELISGEKIEATLLKKRATCFACPIGCKRVVACEDKKISIDPIYGGPEFESIGMLGSNCGINDIKVVSKANELCNKYGMDTISTGATIAFTMECFENKLLNKKDLNGLEPKFGNKEALLGLIDMIKNRQGIGNLLAEGSYRAALSIGKGAKNYSMSVKGQELPSHDPRGKWGVGLGYAISPTGADHLQAAHDPWFDRPPNPKERLSFIDISDMNIFGITEPIKSTSLNPQKIRLFTYLQYIWSLHDVLNLCIFVSVPEFRMMKLQELVKLINAVTGWETGIWELLKLGEKGISMARAFNLIHGLTPKEDKLPNRMFESIKSGPLKGEKISKKEFLKAVKLYYEAMGWDNKKGIPTSGKLAELDLFWIEDFLKDLR